MTMKPARALAFGAAALALLAVFMAYLKPDMALSLANQLWACFR